LESGKSGQIHKKVFISSAGFGIFSPHACCCVEEDMEKNLGAKWGTCEKREDREKVAAERRVGAKRESI